MVDFTPGFALLVSASTQTLEPRDQEHCPPSLHPLGQL